MPLVFTRGSGERLLGTKSCDLEANDAANSWRNRCGRTNTDGERRARRATAKAGSKAMKHILVLIHDDEGQTARLKVAVDLARTLDARLTCLHETMIPESLTDYAGPAGVLAAMREEEREDRHGERMRGRVEAEGVSFDWLDVTGFPAQGIEDHLLLVDLIISSRRLDHGPSPNMAKLARNLLSHQRKPLFLVPPVLNNFDPHGVAALAWDGSAPAEAALVAAIPLLRLASRVLVVEIDGGEASTISEAVHYLDREGVTVGIENRSAQGRSIADALLDTVRAAGASYLVAGAFSRSSTLDRLFGGVTRTLIEKSPVPLFVCH